MVSTRSKLTSEQNPQSVTLSQPLENFKAAVLRVAADNLRRRLTAAEVARLEEGIREKADVLSHTPDHPPYATMIRMALLELNEEGGSSEDSISDFIKNEYADLPWAHSSYLKHYLCKLCNHNEIVSNSENFYLLVDENNLNADRSDRDKPKKAVRETRGKSCKKGNKAKEEEGTSGLEVVVLEEQNKVSKEQNQEQHKHEPMRIKFRYSENQSTRKTIISDLPLTLMDEDQIDPNILDLEENSKEIQGRRLKPAYRNKKPEATSTSALILNLAQPNKQPNEKVKGRGRGRPRKDESFGGREAENRQPRRRGRPRKEERKSEIIPKLLGRMGKMDS